MDKIQQIEYGAFYHIYNRGINGANIFYENENYEHFLRLYEKYIDPVADTFAWCLLRNHFHLLIRILPEDKIEYMKPDEDDKRTFTQKKKYNPSRQFAHLFNAYAKAFNIKYRRTGGLFETPFRRIQVTNEKYFKELVFYIHNNPVKHGFAENLMDYPWSSFLTMISTRPTKTKRETVLGWFNSKAEFIDYHSKLTRRIDISLFEIEDDLL